MTTKKKKRGKDIRTWIPKLTEGDEFRKECMADIYADRPSYDNKFIYLISILKHIIFTTLKCMLNQSNTPSS